MEKCFAMKTRGCSALLGDCPGYDKCPFYKSQSQASEDKLTACERLSSLPPAKQNYIAEKYYHVKMPWDKELENAEASDVQKS